MSGILSPFLGQIPDCKYRSRRIRKKIYKYMMSRHYVPHGKENSKNILELLPCKPLPENLSSVLKGQTKFSLTLLDCTTFDAGVGLQEMRRLAGQQEQSVESLRIQSNRFVCSTAKKRRPLGEIHQYQSADKRQLFFSTAHQQYESPSPQEAIPMISFFNFNEEFELDQPQQQSHLKDNPSLFHMDSHISMRSNPLFDEHIHSDPFQFI